MNQVP